MQIDQPDIEQQNRARKLDIVLKLIDARLRSRFDVLEAIACPDVVVRIIGDKAVSRFAGTFKGRVAARSILEALSIEFDYVKFETDYIMVDGDQVALRWHGDLRHRGTNAQGQFEGFIHIVFRGELVAEYAAYIDMASLAKLSD